MNPAHRPGMRVLVPALVALVVAGCSSGSTQTEPDSGPEVAASSAPPPPPRPVVGSCHDLTLSEAADPVDTGTPVPCREPHTAVTVKVGKIDPVVDGHLVAMDSVTVRNQIADSCPAEPGVFVGGDRTTQRLSRFEVVWFGPSLEQADAGASWYRCDVVAVRSGRALLPLPRRLDGVLDRRGALDRFGTCGTTAPGRRGFERVVCSERHAWRAVAVVDLPRGTRYLGKGASATGDSTCRDVAAERADGDLELTWSFEWPTRPRWTAGQRYGFCWVPS